MAFCGYCGKKLEEGQTCDCPEAVAERTNSFANTENVNQETNPVNNQNQPGINPVNNQNQSQINPVNNQTQQGANQGNTPNLSGVNQNNVQFEQMKEKSGAFLKDTLEAWLSIVKAPVTAGQEFVQSKKLQAGIGLIVFQAILTGIFGILLCSTINDVIGIGSSLFGSSDSSSINLFLAFLLSVIGSLAFTAARVGLILGGVKIFKGTAEWQDLACLCGVRAVGISLMQIISIIMYFINKAYGVEIFVFGCVLGLIFILPGMLECTGVNKDKGIYMILIVSVLSLLVLYILYKIGIPMYLPSDLKKGFDLKDIYRYL